MREKSIFNKDFTIEDVMLYVFGIGIMVFLGFFLIQAQEQLNLQVPNNTKGNCVENSRDPNVQITQLKYDYAGKILLSNSTRKNIAFLVGTILAIFGCMIVIRGVRESPIEGELSAFEKAKIKVKTSSPGIFIVLCGCVIVALSIFVKDKYDIQDPYIPKKYDEVQGYQTPAPLTDGEKDGLLKNHNKNKQN
jgi:hypothetical protein